MDKGVSPDLPLYILLLLFFSPSSSPIASDEKIWPILHKLSLIVNFPINSNCNSSSFKFGGSIVCYLIGSTIHPILFVIKDDQFGWIPTWKSNSEWSKSNVWGSYSRECIARCSAGWTTQCTTRCKSQ